MSDLPDFAPIQECHKALAALHLAYHRAAKPYVDRLTQINNMRPRTLPGITATQAQMDALIYGWSDQKPPPDAVAKKPGEEVKASLCDRLSYASDEFIHKGDRATADLLDEARREIRKLARDQEI
jgi:hypothetical protein